MRPTPNSSLGGRLMLVASLSVYFSGQVNAAVAGSRSPHTPEGQSNSLPHALRDLSLSEQVSQAFAEAVAQSEIVHKTSLFESTKLVEETPFGTTQEVTAIIASAERPAYIPEDADLTPALPQWVTNGKSLLGTKQAVKAKRQAAAAVVDQGTSSSHVQVDANGVITRKYKFDLNYADIAPDGVLRNRAILVNGAFPGPTIEANYGEWIEVEVTNGLTDDGTSMHWHGLLHKESQWMDGTPSIHQCPIAPGRTFTYRFLADQVGSTWWHSHSSAQYTSGAFGALIVHGDGEHMIYDEDLGPVFLSDWYHEPLDNSLQTTMHSVNSQPPPADNLLINGKMNFPCETTQSQCVPNAGISKFFFSPGKKYRLRLINSGAAVNAKFSIDGHSMTVIALDFTPVVPYQTDLVSLANGQRADVVVEATEEAGSTWWMRYDIGNAATPDICIGGLASTTRTAVAAIYYEGADENSIPQSLTAIDPARLVSCMGDSLDKTVPSVPISSDPLGTLQTIEMNVNFTQMRSSGFSEPTNQWTINDIPYHADTGRALLSKAQANTLNTDADFLSLYDVGSAGTVRVVMYDYFQFSHHPMHLHGHNFQVLAEGYGTWDGTITNPSNPMRRDVHVMNRAAVTDQGIIPAYTVIQFFTDNPGVWPFHCHLAWHNSAGLYANFMVRQSDIQQFQIPDSIYQTCVDWNNFKAVANPDQPDAGI